MAHLENAFKKKLDAATAEAEKAKQGQKDIIEARDSASKALNRATQKNKEELEKLAAEKEATAAALQESKA